MNFTPKGPAKERIHWKERRAQLERARLDALKDRIDKLSQESAVFILNIMLASGRVSPEIIKMSLDFVDTVKGDGV